MGQAYFTPAQVRESHQFTQCGRSSARTHQAPHTTLHRLCYHWGFLCCGDKRQRPSAF